MSRVLVVSPHPDDESIGCGGTLRKHVEEGDEVAAIFLTSGEQGGHGRTTEEAARVREAEATDAAAILGLAEIGFWREPDGALRAREVSARRLRECIDTSRPELIYVTHPGEMHRDHRAAARLVRSAIAGLPASRRPEVRMFEIWTPLSRMDLVIDISPFIEVKLAAIRAYRSQCEVLGFDDAFLGLNRYRGEMHCWPVGDYAEIFVRMRLDRD